MDTYCVYQHINKINGKRYIGLTRQTPELRWGLNGINYRDKCPHFWNAIEKYGWDNFDHIVIKTGLTKDEACALEIQLINQYQTQDKEFGYNILSGGTAPSIPEETRYKMSIAMKGNTNGAGHPCSDEKKKKISDAQKGRKFTEDHKQKISNAKRGKSHPSPSDDTRQKIADAHIKTPVYCEETDMVYESIQSCARELNLWATLICKCCRGKLQSTGGYHFHYYNNTINA